jgi:hypothetical protein
MIFVSLLIKHISLTDIEAGALLELHTQSGSKNAEAVYEEGLKKYEMIRAELDSNATKAAEIMNDLTVCFNNFVTLNPDNLSLCRHNLFHSFCCPALSFRSKQILRSDKI